MGPVLVSSRSQKLRSLRCDTSQITPRRSPSRTSTLPNGDSPSRASCLAPEALRRVLELHPRGAHHHTHAAVPDGPPHRHAGEGRHCTPHIRGAADGQRQVAVSIDGGQPAVYRGHIERTHGRPSLFPTYVLLHSHAGESGGTQAETHPLLWRIRRRVFVRLATVTHRETVDVARAVLKVQADLAANLHI